MAVLCSGLFSPSIRVLTFQLASFILVVLPIFRLLFESPLVAVSQPGMGGASNFWATFSKPLPMLGGGHCCPKSGGPVAMIRPKAESAPRVPQCSDHHIKAATRAGLCLETPGRLSLSPSALPRRRGTFWVMALVQKQFRRKIPARVICLE